MAAELLAARGLRKTWAGGPELAYPALRLEEGGLHVLLGANGAGKTTLLRLLCGLEQPDAGWGTAVARRGRGRRCPVLGTEATCPAAAPVRLRRPPAGGLLDLVRPRQAGTARQAARRPSAR